MKIFHQRKAVDFKLTRTRLINGFSDIKANVKTPYSLKKVGGSEAAVVRPPQTMVFRSL
jgi:hypothetical protein